MDNVDIANLSKSIETRLLKCMTCYYTLMTIMQAIVYGRLMFIVLPLGLAFCKATEILTSTMSCIVELEGSE